MKLALRVSTAVILAPILAACGGDNPVTPVGTIGGLYQASEFVTTGSGGQTNQLLAGSTVTINLLPNGATTGHLHLAATASNPAFDADLAGTWAQSGNTVTFEQDADTFIRNMTFTVVPTASSWQLVADQVFAGTRIQLTLSQGGLI